MLVIDPSEQPQNDYIQNNEMDGIFRNNNMPMYGAHNGNLIPRDVIQEDENERTQDSALIKITEEREDTKHASSNQDLNSQGSPLKNFQSMKEEDEEQKYNEDYEDDEEEPVPTKPFDVSMQKDQSVDQAEVLKMINNPVERPTTRNPRMQRNGGKSRESENRQNEGDLGNLDAKVSNSNDKKIKHEIQGNSGFQLPDDDSDED
jgi:hypothetical protein